MALPAGATQFRAKLDPPISNWRRCRHPPRQLRSSNLLERTRYIPRKSFEVNPRAPAGKILALDRRNAGRKNTSSPIHSTVFQVESQLPIVLRPTTAQPSLQKPPRGGSHREPLQSHA